LVTVASIQTVGVILVVSMLITPASTAYMLTNRLSIMITLSATFGAISSIFGLYLSDKTDLPSGPVIALTATGIFIFVFLVAPKQGVLWKSFKKKRARRV